MLALVLTYLVITICSVLLLTIGVAYVRTGVPTVKSARAAQDLAASLLKKQGARRIYELGSGKGDFVLRLARLLPEAHIIGFEISLLPYLYAQIWRLVHPARKRVRFRLADFRCVPLGDADAVVCYLMPRINDKLAAKLANDLKPGTLVLSVSFSFSAWRPVQVLKANNWAKTRLYVYRMPAVTRTKVI
ncbi:MAG: class I SAM-dependent methyltransferase [Parcubacteria group bacterium]